MVDRGLVAEEPDGIHDAYRLTAAGTEGAESYYAWLAARIDGDSSDISTAGPE